MSYIYIINSQISFFKIFIAVPKASQASYDARISPILSPIPSNATPTETAAKLSKKPIKDIATEITTHPHMCLQTYMTIIASMIM